MQILRIPLFLLGVLCTAGLFAQTGQIGGRITDSDGGFGLPGASVFLKDTPGIGAVTELDGTYTISNVTVGAHTVVISYLGFDSEERSVTVVAGDISDVTVALGGQGAASDLDVVLVTGQALGQAKAINQQLNSDGVANFVSADKIKELPDVNAAEAIGRLPGVALSRSGGEGSKIIVRGLDPKFTAININGVRLPSTSGTDRSVDLSLISPELLSGIELFKSPTPDMDGDALGGTVNLKILKADDRPRASIKMMGGYNDLSGEFKDYKATASMSRRIFRNKLGVIATANVERFNRGSDIIGQGWADNGVVLDTFRNIFDQQATRLTLTKRQEIRRRYNGSLGLDYSFGRTTDATLLGVFSRTSRDQFTHSESYGIPGYGSSVSINESQVSLFSGSLSTRHRFNKISIEWGVSHSKVIGETPYSISLNQIAHLANTAPEWDGLERQNPATLYYENTPIVGSMSLFGSSYQETGNNEDISTAYIDLKLPFSIGDKVQAEFKFGGKFRSNSKSRDYDQYYDKLYYLRPITVWDPFDPGNVAGVSEGADPTTYLGMSNFVADNANLSLENNDGQNVDLAVVYDEEKIRRFDRLFRDQYPVNLLNVTNNYSLTENVMAGYAMFKFKWGDQLTVIPGFRYEANDNVYNGIYADLRGDWGEAGNQRDVSTDASYGEFLPHLHIKYKPLNWFDVRASYSTTIARPDFNYIVPSTRINRNGDLSVNQGNPSLGPQVSTNYDLFLTAFDSKFGLISIGGFYKDIQDAFYPLTQQVANDSIQRTLPLPDPEDVNLNNALYTSYTSSPKSEVYGLEFDVQSPLKFLPAPFDKLVFNFNYARLFSSTTINNIRQEQECFQVGPRILCNTLTFPIQREAALIGQASDILNTSLGYDIGGLSARISARYQGSRLTSYSNIADKDRFNRDFWRMDASIKYKFNRRANIFLNLNNLTNQQDVSFFREERFETSRSTDGMTATVGFEYKFIPKDSK